MRAWLTVVVIGLAGCGKVLTLGDGGPADAVRSDASAVCNQESCGPADACCPDACNANNDPDCLPKCGNGVVEGNETCDGNCTACNAEPFTCFEQTGSASNCDQRCHVPIQACTNADRCCPYVAGQGGASCASTGDSECAGTGWQVHEWQPAITWDASTCATVRIYGMSGGDSVLFTTCSPDGQGEVGNSMITSIVDDQGNNYFPQLSPINDDTIDPGALPLLAGWSCKNSAGQQVMSTAPENDGGVVLKANVFRVDVTVCGAGGSAGSGRFFIWWNGSSSPNAG